MLRRREEGAAKGGRENGRQEDEHATWGNVGDAAHLRERLMEIAVGFGLGPDGDEQAARRQLEEALCTEDEHVAEALIDAV